MGSSEEVRGQTRGGGEQRKGTQGPGGPGLSPRGLRLSGVQAGCPTRQGDLGTRSWPDGLAAGTVTEGEGRRGLARPRQSSPWKRQVGDPYWWLAGSRTLAKESVRPCLLALVQPAAKGVHGPACAGGGRNRDGLWRRHTQDRDSLAALPEESAGMDGKWSPPCWERPSPSAVSAISDRGLGPLFPPIPALSNPLGKGRQVLGQLGYPARGE